MRLEFLRATRAALELARRTDRALDLVAARGPILIEGRFAADDAFAVALARLRPAQTLYRGAMADGVALGALRLAATFAAESAAQLGFDERLVARGAIGPTPGSCVRAISGQISASPRGDSTRATDARPSRDQNSARAKRERLSRLVRHSASIARITLLSCKQVNGNAFGE